MKASGRASSAVRRALSRRQDGGVREDTRLYAGIVHQLNVGIAIWQLENLKDPRTFRLVFANPVAEKYFSVPVETAYGKTLADLFPKLLDSQLPKIFQEVALLGEPKDLGEIQYGDEHVRDGIFAVRVYSLRDHCVCVAFEDLTERKKAARALSNQAQLLDLATDSIFVRNMDGRVTYWNQGAERMYGCRKHEVLGQSPFEILKTEGSLPLEDIQKALLREGHWEGELSHVKKDGTRIIVDSHWTLQRDETGSPVGGFKSITKSRN